MPVITLHLIHKSYGPRILLDGLSLTVRRGSRIGLIGRNGEGKSTLLKLIAGLIEADSGDRTLRRGTEVSYLDQDPHFVAGQTVFSVVAEGLGKLGASLVEYDQALQDLETDSSEKAMIHLARLQAELERTGAWLYRVKIESAITRLKLEPHRDVGELSGGWLRRVSLARTTVAEPDILLLDEPTNHLDVPSIEWLEDFVASFPGAVVFVTHDRYFLDAVAEEIIELDRGKLTHFFCSYAGYLEKKAEMLDRETQQHRRFDQLLAREERWIRKGIPARRKRNEGRVRSLMDLRQQRAARRLRGSDVELRIGRGIKPGKMLIETVQLSHRFADQIIIEDLNLKIMAGDRIGLIGPNGIGKTTLLKLLLHKLQPEHGRIRHGVRLVPALLTQIRQLNPELKLKDVLLPNGGHYVHIAGIEPRHIVTYMQDFLFDAEQLRSRVSTLSGGERGRLLLARLLLEPANLLVLDEPTNDLDIGTLAVLEGALTRYEGTVILVSHDRAFMDRVASRTLSFEGNGKIVAIEGGYSDYAAWKSRQRDNREERSKPVPIKSTKPPAVAKKLSYREQHELDGLPSIIENLEAEQTDIEARFCEPDYFKCDAEGFQCDQARLSALQKELSKAYANWESLEEKRITLAS